MRRIRHPSRRAGTAALLWAALLMGGLPGLEPLPGAWARADEDEAPIDPMAEGRSHTVASLRTKIRRAARSPWVENKREEILGYLEALDALGGWEAGRAALEAVVDTDPTLREKAFALAEREHHEKLVPVLTDLLEDKDLRRDADLRRRIAHAYAVMGTTKVIEPLTSLIRTDEPAEVVDEAARALAAHVTATVPQRREPVRRLVDLYETTYNLMVSIRTEDRIQRQVMTKRWDVYGKTVLATLQALTGQQLTRPQEWRRWWNDHKKDTRWLPGDAPEADGPRSRR